jgi:Thioredoxin like C-terminal domain
MRIEYPIVVDNDYRIWRAFDNHYWPALYFVDARGRVREHHFGEGAYERSEMVIQDLLAEAGIAGRRAPVAPVEAHGIEAEADWGNLKTPETYVGSDRTQNFASAGGVDAGRRRAYKVPARLSLNQWALDGEWTVGKQATVVSSRNGRIACRFHARDLHLVMGTSRQDSSVRFRVSIDGRPPGPAHGLDVSDGGEGLVGEPRLYNLIRQSAPIVDRLFEIEFLDAGVEAFSFTFG